MMVRRAEESEQHYFSAALLLLAAEAEAPREDEGRLTARLDHLAANCFYSAGAFALAGGMFAIAAAASRCSHSPTPATTLDSFHVLLLLSLPGRERALH